MSQDLIKALTTQVRTSSEPEFVRIRQLLAQRGIDPHKIAVACLFQDDVRYDFGVIVNQDRSVYQFGFDYLGTTESEGTFSEWEDITSGVNQSTWKDEVGTATAVLISELQA